MTDEFGKIFGDMARIHQIRNDESPLLSDSEDIQKLREHDLHALRDALQDNVTRLIQDSVDSVQMFLNVMADEGEQGMSARRNPEFDKLYGFISDIFRIGGSTDINANGIGLAVLPSAQSVLGKKHDRPVIMIPMPVKEDVFILTISNEPTHNALEICAAWANSEGRRDWPQEFSQMRVLLGKVREVIDIISRISASVLVMAA